MGGAIALTLALKYPERISGLVLLGSGAKMRVARSILDAVEDPDLFKSAAEAVNSNFFSAGASQDLIRLSLQGLLKTNPSVLFGDFLACNQFDVTDQLDKIKIPVLVTCGAEDKMMPPKFSEFLQDNLPNALLYFVENSGHMVQLEQPDIIARLLKNFMDDLALRSAP
jgi:pimeloyl-ACP methyl ester carboxylesterase